MLEGGVVPSASLGKDLPTSLKDLLAEQGAWPGLTGDLPRRAAQVAPVVLDELVLLPCIPHPGKVIRLGVNDVAHAKEGGNQIGDYPALFLRCATSLLAHGANLRVPRVSSTLDFEAELAVVIGRQARFVSEADALDAVFGYACFNNATLDDYQRKTGQWTIGKNFDATGGFGPSLDTADELPPGCVGLRIQSRLIGVVMQDANTAEMALAWRARSRCCLER